MTHRHFEHHSALVILPGGAEVFVDSADVHSDDVLAAQSLCGWAMDMGREIQERTMTCPEEL